MEVRFKKTTFLQRHKGSKTVKIGTSTDDELKFFLIKFFQVIEDEKVVSLVANISFSALEDFLQQVDIQYLSRKSIN